MQDIERIAKLEVAQENSNSDITEMKELVTHMKETLDIINRRMARMGGFIAGVSFVFGLIGTCAAFFIDVLVHRHGS